MLLLPLLAIASLFLVAVGTASAAQATYQFTGTTTSTMTVNNGTSTGSVPAGTPFTGTLTYDEAQTVTPVAFSGGTRSSYSFTGMTLTIGTSKVSWGPGTIYLYDNLTSTSAGYPIGDSFYANINGVAPDGTINGAQFNWIFLGLVDNSGTAFSGGALPATLNYSAFQSRFIEFNYGTQGTPYGAGNTSTLQFLSSLTKSGASAPITFAPSLPSGTLGVPYSATFSPASGGTGSFTYSAAGLPAGLSLSGNTVSGTAGLAGSFPVTLTATDSANASVSASLVLVIDAPTPTTCSGTNAVETAYVARNPGYIVINGGLNLLDHLWTTNLNASNTTFLGGLVNWYQTGLILNYTGATDPNGCILDSLTVAPAVTVSTTSLPSGVVGQAYQAPVAAAWGVAPYQLTVSGLPAGLGFDGANIKGTPLAAGTFTVAVSVSDSLGATSAAQLTLTVDPGNYTTSDQGKGKITAIDPNLGYVMVGSKKLVWDASTIIIVNTPNGELHVVDAFVQVGMKVQWKGLRDKTTNTVLTTKIEIN